MFLETGQVCQAKNSLSPNFPGNNLTSEGKKSYSKLERDQRQTNCLYTAIFMTLLKQGSDFISQRGVNGITIKFIFYLGAISIFLENVWSVLSETEKYG